MMHSFLLKLRTIYEFWLKQWAVDTPGEKPSVKSFLIRIGSVLLLYLILDRVLMKITNLPFENYQEPFIYFAFLKHIFASWYILLLILCRRVGPTYSLVGPILILWLSLIG